MSDLLEQLPTDQSVVSHSEAQIIGSIFKENGGSFKKLLNGTRDVLLAGIIFIIVSLPQFEPIIKNFFPITNNSYMFLLGLKVLIFMLLFFVFKNFSLSQKT